MMWHPEQAGINLARRAALFADLGRNLQAESTLREAITLAPENAELRLQLGETLLAQDRPGEAYEEAMFSLSLDPMAPLGHLLAGRACLTMMALTRSLEHLKSALECRMDWAAPHFYLAIAMIELERYSEAGEAIDRAIALAPDVAVLHGHRGLLLARRRDRKALDAAERAAELGIEDSVALKLAGQVYYTFGRFRQASVLWGAALRLNPRDTELVCWLTLAAVRANPWTSGVYFAGSAAMSLRNPKTFHALWKLVWYEVATAGGVSSRLWWLAFGLAGLGGVIILWDAALKRPFRFLPEGG